MAKVDVTPATLDLVLYAGDSTAITITVHDEAEQPVDVSDRTWAAQWRAGRSAPTAFDLTVDATNAATGVLIVHFAGDQTAQMPTLGVWDLEGTPVGGGDPDTILGGSTQTQRDVTRLP